MTYGLAAEASAAATIAAYWLQQTRGIGQHIDISMQEVLATDADHKTVGLISWAYSGTAITANVVGRSDPRELASDVTPTGVYPCKDGYVRTAVKY